MGTVNHRLPAHLADQADASLISLDVVDALDTEGLVGVMCEINDLATSTAYPQMRRGRRARPGSRAPSLGAGVGSSRSPVGAS
jgi:hypothetical protein